MAKDNKEADKTHTLSGRKERIIGMLKGWFNDPYNKTLLAILLLSLAIRLFYFFLVKQQPLWMDEAEYMVQAKRLAFGYDWFWQWSPRKPILMSFIFSLLFRVGFGEMFMRFLMLLTSVLAVYLTYLVSADFFGKRVGLISSFIMSIWWVHLFFTVRLLTWLPSATLLLAAVHFFYRGYVKKQGTGFLLLFGIFFALAFLMRVTAGIMIIPLIFYAILQDKWRFITKKDVWLAVLFMFIVLLPFFIWLYQAYPEDPIGKFIGLKYGRFSIGEEHGSMGLAGIPAYLKDIPNLLYMPFFLLFLAGLFFVLADLVLGLDLIFKKDYQKLRFYLLALAWILLPIVAYGISRSYVEQRDAMVFAVFMFSIAGIGTVRIYDLIKKYNKILAIAVIAGVLVLATFFQLASGYNLINTRKDSYVPVRDAALWISQQDNTNEDTIISKALPQITYYSELSARDIPENEEDMLTVISENNAKYFVSSTFEPSWLIPSWSYDWGERNLEIAKRVWLWVDDPEQVGNFVVVYELDREAIKNRLAQQAQNKTA